MKCTTVKILAKAVLLSAAFTLLQACAPSNTHYASVSDAFQTSNVITVKPYTRTIFSNNDF